MKKFLMTMLTFAMLLSLCACGGPTEPTKPGTKAEPHTHTDAEVQPNPGDSPDAVVGDRDNDDTPSMMVDENGNLVFGTPQIDDDPVDHEDTEDGDWEPFTIQTGDVVGAKLLDKAVKPAIGIYDFSTPAYEDSEFNYTVFEMPIKIKESDLSGRYTGIGEFEDQDSFMGAWAPYAKGLLEDVKHNNTLTDVILYGEEENGDHIFGNDADNTHSYSLAAKQDGYQNVNYTFLQYIDTENESWDRYDYSKLVELLNYYTGIELTTGDLYAMQEIAAKHMSEGAEGWSVEVKSNERDNYDEFRVTVSNFMDGVQSWQFSVDRMINKWADLYDREALRNGLIEGSSER